MCSRFNLDEPTFYSAVSQFHLSGSERITVTSRDIYPSETAPVIIGDPGRGLDELMVVNQVWGFPSPNEKGLFTAETDVLTGRPPESMCDPGKLFL